MEHEEQLTKEINYDIKDGRKMISNKVPIREFSFDMLCADPTIVIIAKRGSGKSFFTRNLLNYYRDIPCSIVISKTEKADPYFSCFFPDSYIYYEYDSKIIGKILFRQEEMKKKKGEKELRGKKLDVRACITMDDCLADSHEWKKDKFMKDLFFNGRHYEITFILVMQEPMGIGPDLRSNIDYIFLLASDQKTQRKKIFDHYVGIFNTFESFCQVYDALTTDFGIMVYVNTDRKPANGKPLNDPKNEKSIFDKIFWYKAKFIEDEKLRGHIGCSQFKKFHNENYNVNWKDIENKRKYAEIFQSNLDTKRGKRTIGIHKMKK